jgi:hypothetical protein
MGIPRSGERDDGRWLGPSTGSRGARTTTEQEAEENGCTGWESRLTRMSYCRCTGIYCRWEKAWLIFNETKVLFEFDIVCFLHNMAKEHTQIK